MIPGNTDTSYIIKVVMIISSMVLGQRVLLLTASWASRTHRYSVMLNLIDSVLWCRLNAISVIIIINWIRHNSSSITTSSKDTASPHANSGRVTLYHASSCSNCVNWLMLRRQIGMYSYRFLSWGRQEILLIVTRSCWTWNWGLRSICSISMHCWVVAMIIKAGSCCHSCWN